MLQRSIRHQTALIRLFGMAIFVILGSAVLHSTFAARPSSDRASVSMDYPPPALEAEKGGPALPDGAAADTPAPAAGAHRTSRRVEQRPPKQHLSELEEGRREVFTMITALMMQLQSTGAGGK